jgi:hypothetical protein
MRTSTPIKIINVGKLCVSPHQIESFSYVSESRKHESFNVCFFVAFPSMKRRFRTRVLLWSEPSLIILKSKLGFANLEVTGT